MRIVPENESPVSEAHIVKTSTWYAIRIIFRSLQGAGGAGIYSLAILCMYELVPKPKVPLYGALLAVTIALASLTGPIFGGLVAENSAWRWAFYLKWVI